jgi:hypothetical protein
MWVPLVGSVPLDCLTAGLQEFGRRSQAACSPVDLAAHHQTKPVWENTLHHPARQGCRVTRHAASVVDWSLPSSSSLPSRRRGPPTVALVAGRWISLSQGKASRKSNVFSYGIMQFQVLTAKQPRRSCLLPLKSTAGASHLSSTFPPFYYISWGP